MYGGRELSCDFFFILLFVYFLLFSFYFLFFAPFVFSLYSFCFHIVHFHFLFFSYSFFFHFISLFEMKLNKNHVGVSWSCRLSTKVNWQFNDMLKLMSWLIKLVNDFTVNETLFQNVTKFLSMIYQNNTKMPWK